MHFRIIKKKNSTIIFLGAYMCHKKVEEIACLMIYNSRQQNMYKHDVKSKTEEIQITKVN